MNEETQAHKTARAIPPEAGSEANVQRRLETRIKRSRCWPVQPRLTIVVFEYNLRSRDLKTGSDERSTVLTSCPHAILGLQ